MRYVILSVAYGLLLAGCAQNASVSDEAAVPQTKNANPGDSRLCEEWGVEVLGVTRTAAGYMLDFRYRVVDPEKALPLLSRKGKVRSYLIDQATGATLFVPSSPKVGPLRQTSLTATPGRVYYTLFANPGGLVKPGGKVTVVIGEFRVEDLLVR